jgi:hypothetical protein
MKPYEGICTQIRLHTYFALAHYYFASSVLDTYGMMSDFTPPLTIDFCHLLSRLRYRRYVFQQDIQRLCIILKNRTDMLVADNNHVLSIFLRVLRIIVLHLFDLLTGRWFDPS